MSDDYPEDAPDQAADMAAMFDTLARSAVAAVRPSPGSGRADDATPPDGAGGPGDAQREAARARIRARVPRQLAEAVEYLEQRLRDSGMEIAGETVPARAFVLVDGISVDEVNAAQGLVDPEILLVRSAAARKSYDYPDRLCFTWSPDVGTWLQ
jgi:hypothetical protein